MSGKSGVFRVSHPQSGPFVVTGWWPHMDQSSGAHSAITLANNSPCPFSEPCYFSVWATDPLSGICAQGQCSVAGTLYWEILRIFRLWSNERVKALFFQSLFPHFFINVSGWHKASLSQSAHLYQAKSLSALIYQLGVFLRDRGLQMKYYSSRWLLL